MLLLSALPARATDDMLIYSDRFNNGWGDNWSWMPRYPTNSPVYSGSNSMACVPSGTWQAWWLKSGTSVDTTIYTNVSFWLNGGATGGQSIVVSGESDGSGLPGIWVTAPTNTWQQFTISLAALGINNKRNLTGFQIGNGNSTQPFFIDDMRLVAAPAFAVVHVGITATQVVRKVDGKVFGINQVGWDGGVNTPASVTLLNDMGNPCLRWPGGSWGDGYHWTNEAWSAASTSPRTWGSFSKDFIALATNTHAQAFIIVNYGTSDASEAAYGVRMFNITNHCNFKYWEVGNEVGGSWEWDWNTNAPFKAHDPWTYAMRFKDYYTQMKAADPTIKIGAVADITEDGTVNNYDHPVVNPRTGVTHYGWTPVMLTYMRSNNCIPDFLIEHNYGPAAGDTQDLLYTRCWASHAASLRQMLTDYLGSAGSNVTLEATECGTGGDKQCVSVTGGLFYADTIGQILQTEFNSRLWWEMRGGTATLSDPDPAFYGWRTNSDGTYLVDGGIVYGSGGVGGVGYAYPTYYVAKLMPYFAVDGDTVVSATSDYPLLAVYSVKRTNGNLTLLVINKSSSSNLTANINLSGYLPYTNATVYSYGIPQDDAVRTGVGSPDFATTNLAGAQGSFSATFAPFSATVLVLSAANQPPFTPANLVATASNAAVALTWSPAIGADSYLIRRSTTSGGNYATIATGVAATSCLDTGLVNGTTYYYVVAATNAYGVSSNSVEVSAKPMIKFVGAVIGSPGSWGNYGNTISNVFDGNTNTFYDAVNSAGDWAGLDLGSGAAATVMQIRYCPRAGFASRMVGGQFQGANMAGFSSGVVTLFTISSTPPDGVMTVQSVTSAASFRYLRYLGLAGGYCDVAEVEFWGRNAVPPSAPTGLTAVAGDANVALSWSASATATNYFVKRSLTSGTGYTSIATNASLAFTNTGLVNGTLYYFVVSAVNAFGESTNSAQVSARSTSSAPVAISATNASGQLRISWPTDHTGWQLQSQTNSLGVGLGTNWINVTGTIQTNQVVLPLNAAGGAVFFRLVRP
jgi:alpha-L-arabinofuranosidase